MKHASLVIWTVYENPLDYPGKWALRAHYVERGGVRAASECAVRDSLEEIRKCVPAGLTQMQRHRDDDPAIYEVWL